MSELDDLRRVAYGRTSSPAEEAAAVAARAALAHLHSPTVVEVVAAEPEPEPEAVEPDTLTIVEVPDEPGYARRLAATWRAWAGPAFVAFVLGVVLTVASGVLVLNSVRNSGYDGGIDILVGEPSLALGAGDLEAATAVLSSPQTPEDLVDQLDSGVDSGSTHVVRATNSQLVYAVMSVDGDICLMAVESASGDSMRTCVPPSDFSVSGVSVMRVADGESMRLHWDGVHVSETRTPQ